MGRLCHLAFSSGQGAISPEHVKRLGSGLVPERLDLGCCLPSLLYPPTLCLAFTSLGNKDVNLTTLPVKVEAAPGPFSLFQVC